MIQIDRDALVRDLERRLPWTTVEAETINPDFASWEITVRDGRNAVRISWGPLSGFGATDLNNIREDISPFLAHDWTLESAQAAVEFAAVIFARDIA